MKKSYHSMVVPIACADATRTSDCRGEVLVSTAMSVLSCGPVAATSAGDDGDPVPFVEHRAEHARQVLLRAVGAVDDELSGAARRSAVQPGGGLAVPV